MLPGTYNLQMYQGDTFDLLVVLRDRVYDSGLGEWVLGEPVNIGGGSARAHFRNTREAAEFVAFTCFVPNDASGQVLVSLAASQTVTLPSTGFWDLEVTLPNGSVKTYLRGTVNVEREVTR